MAKNDIDQIKQTAGPYSKEALEGRQKFLDLRLRQDPEIVKIFTRAADRLAAQIKKGGISPLRQKQLVAIKAQLRQEAKAIENELTDKINTYIEQGAEAGSWQSRAVAVKLFGTAQSPKVTMAGLDRMFVRVNRQAVAAIWNRTQNGMMLSDRIWKTGQNARSAIQNIIQSAVASGQDAVTTAKALEQYVKKGAGTLARHYPAMMEHMRGRVPKNLSYEALRLARTEMTAAFGQGQIRTAQATPGVKGIKYCLSSAHRIVDICDELARNNEAGLGPGVYAVDDPPPYPAHPNTMSYLVTVYDKPENFVNRLKEWTKNPGNDLKLEEWYNNQYNIKEKPDEAISLPRSSKVTKQANAAISKPLMPKKNDKSYRQIPEKELPQFIKHMTHNWNPTKQEIQAFMDYIGANEYSMVDYQAINTFLRMGESSYLDWYKNKISPELIKSLKSHISIMTKAIERSAIPENIILYRTCDRSALLGKSIGILNDETLQQLIGKTIIDNGFVSTSLKKHTIVSELLESRDVLFEIRAPKGTKGQYISDLAGYDKEAEILLQKGTKFRILEYTRTKRQSNNDLITVICEVIE